MPNRPPGAVRRARRRVTTVVVAAAIVVIGAASVRGATAGPAAYRLATVRLGATGATVSAVGTIQPADQVTASFPVGGRVAGVAVTAGDHVRAGQILATLDATAMNVQVASAVSTLDGVRARLAADESSQAATTPAATTPAVTGPGSSGGRTTGSGRGSAAGSAARRSAAGALNRLQAAVVSSQRTVDAALAIARASLHLVGVACPVPVPTATPTLSPTATPTATPTVSPTAAPTASPAPPAGHRPTGCEAAETTLLQGESAVLRDEQVVGSAEAALDAAIARALATPAAGGSAGTGPTGSSSGGSASGSARSSTAAGAGGSTGVAVTAQSLAADQAQVDAGSAALAAARQGLAAATLTSPIAGVVELVGFSAGDRVGADSATQDVVVAGPGEDEVVAQVPVTSLPSIALGQPVTVRPDGGQAPVTGTVGEIGYLPVSGRTPSYPVTVSVPRSGLANGAGASLTFVGRGAADTLVVPTSAVTLDARGGTVRVDRNGVASTVRVQVGVVGPVYTQVTGGLTAGQQVVLADLGAPLPTAGGPFLRGLGGGFGGGAGRG